MGLLRVLLAVSVFMAHVPKDQVTTLLLGFGGENSVELFFIVSGFYIAQILDKSYSTKIGFYYNRILKLYPIYFIICALVLLRALTVPFFRESLFSFPTKALALGTFTNSTLVGSDWLMFLQWREGNFYFGSFNSSELPLWGMLLVPQSWSIGIELTFYFLAPVLCKAKSRTLFLIGITLLASRFAGLILGLNEDPWTYRFFPFELPMFIFGILLYRFRTHLDNSLRIGIKKIWTLVIVSYVSFSYLTINSSINRFWQMLILISMLSIVIVWGENKSQDRKLGELSYPIYMSHVLVISTYGAGINFLSRRSTFFEKVNVPLLTTINSLLITILFSYLLLHIVRPVEKIRNKNRK